MKIGIVSTMNCQCGISTYTEHLVEQFPEDEVIIFGNNLGVMSDTKSCLKHPIIRCWDRGVDDLKQLTQEIIKSGVQCVHFQHEFGLFQNHQAFLEMLKELKSHDIGILITLHTIFLDKSRNINITRCAPYVDIFIVHHEQFKGDLGVLGKTVVLPHASVLRTKKPKEEARKYLSIPQDKIVCLTMGFITPTKGAMDNVSTVIRLEEEFDNNILLIIVGFPIVHGKHFANLEYCLKLYKRVATIDAFDKIRIIPKYIEESELDWYAGASDVVIENYYDTQDSISGMSHLVMSYGLPSISSRARILSDLDETRSLKYEIRDVQGMTDQLRKLLNDGNLRQQLSENCLKYTQATSWPIVADQTWEYYKIFNK